jgi:hypothetical protein
MKYDKSLRTSILLMIVSLNCHSFGLTIYIYNDLVMDGNLDNRHNFFYRTSKKIKFIGLHRLNVINYLS